MSANYDNKTTYQPLQKLPPGHLLTSKEASYYLKTHPRTVEEMIRGNRIPYHRIGHRTVRISVADLLSFLNRIHVEATAPLPPNRVFTPRASRSKKRKSAKQTEADPVEA
jgi:excisionase family DNA binding protein